MQSREKCVIMTVSGATQVENREVGCKSRTAPATVRRTEQRHPQGEGAAAKAGRSQETGPTKIQAVVSVGDDGRFCRASLERTGGFFMKRQTIKRAAAFLLVALVVCVLAVALVACDSSLKDRVKELENEVNGIKEEYGIKDVTIYIGDEEITSTTNGVYVMDTLKELFGKKKIANLKYTEGEYGAMISELGTLVAGSNSYIAFYHTVDNESLKGTDWKTGETITKNAFGKTFYYANLGVSSFPVYDGASYWFVLETF